MTDLTIAIDALDRDRATLQANYDATASLLESDLDTGLEDPVSQQETRLAQIAGLTAGLILLQAGDTELRSTMLRLAHDARRGAGNSPVPVVAIIGDAEKLLLFAQGRPQEEQP